MSEVARPKVAIVDYGMGNLFSVLHACEHSSLQASITSSAQEILAADAVILPGVGAFGDAMDALRRLKLIEPLQRMASSPTPLFGICLGMQLLLSESFEFGRNAGLDIIPGAVVRLETRSGDERRLKVPQVCWNQVFRAGSPEQDPWAGSPLAGLPDGVFMYFVHSFYSKPDDPSTMVSTTLYGGTEFCSGLRRGNVFACQYHPERSGPAGLQIYRNLLSLIEGNI